MSYFSCIVALLTCLLLECYIYLPTRFRLHVVFSSDLLYDACFANFVPRAIYASPVLRPRLLPSLSAVSPRLPTRPDYAVAMDIFTIDTLSRSNHRYCLLFVDMATGFLTFKYLANRSDAYTFAEYVLIAKRRGRPLKIVRLDNTA